MADILDNTTLCIIQVQHKVDTPFFSCFLSFSKARSLACWWRRNTAHRRTFCLLTIKNSRFSASFRGISRLGCAIIFLRWFKLAHICFNGDHLIFDELPCLAKDHVCHNPFATMLAYMAHCCLEFPFFMLLMHVRVVRRFRLRDVITGEIFGRYLPSCVGHEPEWRKQDENQTDWKGIEKGDLFIYLLTKESSCLQNWSGFLTCCV